MWSLSAGSGGKGALSNGKKHQSRRGVYMDKQGKVAIFLALTLAVVLAASLVMAGPKECNNGLDDDGDGAIDRADGGCENRKDSDESNCGDGVCEGGETTSSCSADCVPPPPADSCTDSDGGFDIFTQGTVSGFFGGSPYNNTDFCGNSVVLLEYFCVGDNAHITNTSCVTNSTSSCVNGACV